MKRRKKKLALRSGKRHRETIAIVGPGRLGANLALRLSEAGHTITEIVTSTRSRSLPPTRALGRKLDAQVSSVSTARLNAEIIWFCVPDSEIAASAAALSDRNWRSRIAFHSSGVLPSDDLSVLRKRGATVASVHPLMTFVQGSNPELLKVPFAIEGDAFAVRAATQIVVDLGGEPFHIRKREKLAYHAFATMICPLLLSLLVTSERVAALAGMSESTARRRMLPILRQTIANYERLGAAASFSGPLVRGDAGTIARHLTILNRAPHAKRIYAELALAALKYLPNRNGKKIAALLRG